MGRGSFWFLDFREEGSIDIRSWEKWVGGPVLVSLAARRRAERKLEKQAPSSPDDETGSSRGGVIRGRTTRQVSNGTN